MRIGLLTTSYPRFVGDVGGSFVATFAKGLVAAGHRVTVLAPEPQGIADEAPLDPTWVRYLPRPLERTFHGAGVPDNLRRDPLAWPGALAYPLALLREGRRQVHGWDAVVSHFGLPCGLVGERIRGRRPHLCVWHSADVHLQSRLPAATRRWMHRPGLTHWTVTESARLSLGLDERTIVEPMPAEPAAPTDRAEARRALGVEGFVVATLGRLVPIKGLDRLIDACEGVEGVTVLVAGDGPEREVLRQRARERGVDARFVGAIHGESKAQLLAAADVMAFPSRALSSGRREGSPVALEEAQLAGLPVLASATGGLRERLANARTGTLVADSVDGWRAAIRRARDDGRPRPTPAAPRVEHVTQLALAALQTGRGGRLQRPDPSAQGLTRRVPAGGR